MAFICAQGGTTSLSTAGPVAVDWETLARWMPPGLGVDLDVVRRAVGSAVQVAACGGTIELVFDSSGDSRAQGDLCQWLREQERARSPGPPRVLDAFAEAANRGASCQPEISDSQQRWRIVCAEPRSAAALHVSSEPHYLFVSVIRTRSAAWSEIEARELAESLHMAFQKRQALQHVTEGRSFILAVAAVMDLRNICGGEGQRGAAGDGVLERLASLFTRLGYVPEAAGQLRPPPSRLDFVVVSCSKAVAAAATTTVQHALEMRAVDAQTLARSRAVALRPDSGAAAVMQAFPHVKFLMSGGRLLARRVRPPPAYLTALRTVLAATGARIDAPACTPVTDELLRSAAFRQSRRTRRRLVWRFFSRLALDAADGVPSGSLMEAAQRASASRARWSNVNHAVTDAALETLTQLCELEQGSSEALRAYLLGLLPPPSADVRVRWFHGTSEADAISIIRNGISTTYFGRSWDPRADFGSAFYLTADVAYAFEHAMNHVERDSDHGAVLVFDVPHEFFSHPAVVPKFITGDLWAEVVRAGCANVYQEEHGGTSALLDPATVVDGLSADDSNPSGMFAPSDHPQTALRLTREQSQRRELPNVFNAFQSMVKVSVLRIPCEEDIVARHGEYD